MTSDKVALAKRLLEAHDALQAARACEPPSDEEGDGLPYDAHGAKPFVRQSDGLDT